MVGMAFFFVLPNPPSSARARVRAFVKIIPRVLVKNLSLYVGDVQTQLARVKIKGGRGRCHETRKDT